jgi:cytidylate kinase
VLEGRDIGTVVFPDAPVKIFLDATAQERARRRHDELVARGEPALYDDVLDEVRRRDAQDAGRDVAPLKAADDAIIVDSTRMSIDDVVARVVGAVESIVTAGRG